MAETVSESKGNRDLPPNWYGGPRFIKVKKWANGAQNSRTPGRKSHLAEVRAALDGSYPHWQRDAAFYAEHGRHYFIP